MSRTDRVTVETANIPARTTLDVVSGDGITIVHTDSEANDTTTVDIANDGVRRAAVTIGTANAMGVWQNTAGAAIIIDEVIVNIATSSDGACTMDVGTTPTSATTSSDNLLDGLDVVAAAGLFSNKNDTDNGTNGRAYQTLAAGKWVTFTKATGTTTGLVATATILYHLA